MGAAPACPGAEAALLVHFVCSFYFFSVLPMLFMGFFFFFFLISKAERFC